MKKIKVTLLITSVLLLSLIVFLKNLDFSQSINSAAKTYIHVKEEMKVNGINSIDQVKIKVDSVNQITKSIPLSN